MFDVVLLAEVPSEGFRGVGRIGVVKRGRITMHPSYGCDGAWHLQVRRGQSCRFATLPSQPVGFPQSPPCPLLLPPVQIRLSRDAIQLRPAIPRVSAALNSLLENENRFPRFQVSALGVSSFKSPVPGPRSVVPSSRGPVVHLPSLSGTRFQPQKHGWVHGSVHGLICQIPNK